jgi:hypothetical protein
LNKRKKKSLPKSVSPQEFIHEMEGCVTKRNSINRPLGTQENVGTQKGLIGAPAGIWTRVADSKGQYTWPDYTTGAQLLRSIKQNAFSFE